MHSKRDRGGKGEAAHDPATMNFVEYCTVKTENGSKENMLEKPWFTFFYQQASERYYRRHGDAVKGKSENHAPSVVLIYGTPFEVQIPLSVDGGWKSATGRWFCWPDEVLKKYFQFFQCGVILSCSCRQHNNPVINCATVNTAKYRAGFSRRLTGRTQWIPIHSVRNEVSPW